MLGNLHCILRATRSVAECEVVVSFVLLEDHLRCCVESYARGLYQRQTDNLGGCCSNPDKI